MGLFTNAIKKCHLYVLTYRINVLYTPVVGPRLGRPIFECSHSICLSYRPDKSIIFFVHGDYGIAFCGTQINHVTYLLHRIRQFRITFSVVGFIDWIVPALLYRKIQYVVQIKKYEWQTNIDIMLQPMVFWNQSTGGFCISFCEICTWLTPFILHGIGREWFYQYNSGLLLRLFAYFPSAYQANLNHKCESIK